MKCWVAPAALLLALASGPAAAEAESVTAVDGVLLIEET